MTQVDKEEIRQKTEMKTEPAQVIKYQDDTKTAIQEIKYALAMIKTDTTEKGVVRHTFERLFLDNREKGLRYEDDDSEDEHERLTRTDIIDK